MNRKQVQVAKRDQEDRRNLAALHSSLEQAGIVLKLSDAVIATGAALLNRIPRDADEPISPASVQNLASERGCEPRTIHNHIRKLIDCGLAEDRCLDGGRRHCQRDQSGKTVAIHGVSFAPLVERAPEIEDRAAAIRHDQIEHKRLRYEISRLRRTMRRMIANPNVDEELQATWATLPRRIAGLSLETLRLLISQVQRLYDALIAATEATQCQKERTDRSEKNERPYTTYHSHSDFCNDREDVQKSNDCGKAQNRLTCGLEHITLNMVFQAAPEEWHRSIEHHGGLSWRSFVTVAHERSDLLDVHPSAWAQAQAALGQAGAALLILIADAQTYDRGGNIRSPGGWVRRMSERAENGSAQLHRSVFGLLHRKEAA